MDAFYASVEQRDNPPLQGRPVIVGGSRERGVVCACSYETRPAGVRSGMPMSRAIRLCPEATVLPVRMSRYQEVSAEVFTIFKRYTDLVEPLSIDEAFLDVAGCQRLHGTAEAIAGAIRSQVKNDLSLAVSAGVAPNKFLAKLCSDASKPDGLLMLRCNQVDDFLLPLPVGKIWGVGKKTAEQLARLGIATVADLRRLEEKVLTARFGKLGTHLFQLARGIDPRPVVVADETKSIGAEETFSQDILSGAELDRELSALVERVMHRLRRHGLKARGMTLKVKYSDFTVVTRSRTLAVATDGTKEVLAVCRSLLEKTAAGTRPVRLLGVSAADFDGGEVKQGGLFDSFREALDRQAAIDQAMDLLRGRFGRPGAQLASSMGRSGSVQKTEEFGEDTE